MIFANQYQHFNRVTYMTTCDGTRVQYGFDRNEMVYLRIVHVAHLFATRHQYRLVDPI